MNNNCLAHHGRKGQKWGVQNGPPYPLGGNGLKKFRKNAKKQSDPEHTSIVAKGTELQRISTRRETKPRADRAYLAYKEHDKDYYTEHITDFRRGETASGKMYKVKYRALEDIKYPDHDKMVDEFMKLYSKKKVRVINEISKEMAERYSFGYRDPKAHDYVKKYYTKLYKDLYNKSSKDELRTHGYKTFIAAYSNISVSKLYQESLKKQGYNAIRDENDILYNKMFKDNPTDSLIVFDPNKNLKIVKNEELSEEEYNAAKKRNQERLEKKG